MRIEFTLLAQRWENIAAKLDKQPVEMTAATHRLFANEVRAVAAKNAAAGFSWNGYTIHGEPDSVAAVVELVKEVRELHRIINGVRIALK